MSAGRRMERDPRPSGLRQGGLPGLRLGLAGLLLSLGGCLSGCNTGSETGNPAKGVSGTVESLDGVPAARAQVYLIPRDFNPLDLVSGKTASLHIDTTDAQGRFHFTGVDSGLYNLEAKSLANGTGFIVKDIPVAGSRVDLPKQALRSSGKIAATLEGASDTVSGYVYILGTTYHQRVRSSAGTVSLDSLPPGKVDSLIYGNPQGTVAPKTFAWKLEVKPDTSASASGPYLAWKYSAAVFLNTSASGVKLSGPVSHFPLRIDLGAAGLDFAAARPDGADLRVTNERGVPLPCEIQLWDATAGSGQLWARVDTVFADSFQKIRLYWGYGGGGAVPAGWPAGSVFAAADGFVAAWHLDEDPFLAGRKLQDKSGTQNDGIAIGYTAEGGTVSGVVGNGIAFDGKTQWVGSLKAFANPNVFTYSGWFKTSTTDGGRLFDFADKDTSVNPNYWDRLIIMYPNGTLHFGVYPSILPGKPMPTPSTYNILHGDSPQNDGQWHHVAARLSARGQAFFLDGVKIGNDPATVEGENVLGYWRLGFGHLSEWAQAGTSLYFQGAMDEVWIAHADFSDDFVKLSYENQKTGTRLLNAP